ncbi:MAG: hydroxyacid dehydrogenase [Desulfobacteraceae bacterium]|nr:hydroxyacid dehydrogenase [Desulfobacteraceae bacterium]
MTISTLLLEARPFCVFDDTAMKILKDRGFQLIDMRGSGMQDLAFVEALGKTDIIVCGNDLLVNDAVLDKAPDLKAVAKLGAGLDTVDINAMTARKIPVFHTPGVNNHAVADHTFALILCLARKLLFCDRSMRANQWEHTKIMGLEIWQKTIGILGLGAIGQNVARRAKGFDMKVVAYDPFWPEEFAEKYDIERMGIEEVLKVSDIVSLHLPLLPETTSLIDKHSLDLMKPSALVINCARGGVVNEKDLYDALKNGTIAGAGIDVFENEPPTDTPFAALDNVVLTPHTAAFTTEAMNKMNDHIAEQIIEMADGKRARHTVNPSVYEYM